MTEIEYPQSSEQSSGDPTSRQEINRLRVDAIYLGMVEDDGEGTVQAVTLGDMLKRYSMGMIMDGVGTTTITIQHSARKPPTVVVDGYMLQASGNVTLSMSGKAADTWYIFAVRTEDSTGITLVARDTAAEGSNDRIIGEVEYDGSEITEITNYEGENYRGGKENECYGYISETGVITSGQGIASASNDGTGDFTITFSTAYDNTNYMILLSVENVGSNPRMITVSEKLVGGISVHIENAGATDKDDPWYVHTWAVG